MPCRHYNYIYNIQVFVTLPSFTETIATADEKEDICPKENTCTVLHTSFADWAVNPGIMLFSEQPNWAAGYWRLADGLWIHTAV